MYDAPQIIRIYLCATVESRKIEEKISRLLTAKLPDTNDTHQNIVLFTINIGTLTFCSKCSAMQFYNLLIRLTVLKE